MNDRGSNEVFPPSRDEALHDELPFPISREPEEGKNELGLSICLQSVYKDWLAKEGREPHPHVSEAIRGLDFVISQHIDKGALAIGLGAVGVRLNKVKYDPTKLSPILIRTLEQINPNSRATIALSFRQDDAQIRMQVASIGFVFGRAIIDHMGTLPA